MGQAALNTEYKKQVYCKIRREESGGKKKGYRIYKTQQLKMSIKKSKFDHKGKVAIVTCSSRGLGSHSKGLPERGQSYDQLA